MTKTLFFFSHCGFRGLDQPARYLVGSNLDVHRQSLETPKMGIRCPFPINNGHLCDNEYWSAHSSNGVKISSFLDSPVQRGSTKLHSIVSCSHPQERAT